MAKKAVKSTYMTSTERIGGLLLFVLYLLSPALLSGARSLIGTLLDTSISESSACVLCYWFFALTAALLFHRFLGASASRLFSNLNRGTGSVGLALVCYYGANELFYRAARNLLSGIGNLNDGILAAETSALPRTTTLVIVLLAPFVEEVLFQGLVFGNLAEKSRPVAYAVTCLLFAFSHSWALLHAGISITGLVRLLQYLLPGLVLSWAYDRSGSVWVSILVHVCVNALALGVFL